MVHHRRRPFRLALFLIVIIVGGGFGAWNIRAVAVKKQAYELGLASVNQQMGSIRDRGGDATKTFAAVKDPVDSDWLKLETDATAVSKEYADLSGAAAALEPPPDDKAAHDRLLATLHFKSGMYKKIAEAAHARDPRQVRDAVFEGAQQAEGAAKPPD